jgi:MYXO-CTERM domain-containing protein
MSWLVRVLVVWVTSLAILSAFPRSARAFCRTTTAAVPPGYDPVESGCWTEGRPIAWTAGRVSYALASSSSRQVLLADATRIAHLAFDSWNRAFCAGRGAPQIQTFDDGPLPVVAGADCGAPPCAGASNMGNLIIFDDDGWPHNDPANTLALTTITYGADSGVVLHAQVDVNSYQHMLTAEEPPPPGAFDLQAILTHEAGHFLGLAHATDPHSVMYAYYRPGAIALTQDDVDGVCAIYPPVPAGGCSCAAGAADPGAMAVAAGLGIAGLGLARLKMRRRA